MGIDAQAVSSGLANLDLACAVLVNDAPGMLQDVGPQTLGK